MVNVPPNAPKEDRNDQTLEGQFGQSPYGPDEASPFQAGRAKPFVNQIFTVTEDLPRPINRIVRHSLSSVHR